MVVFHWTVTVRIYVCFIVYSWCFTLLDGITTTSGKSWCMHEQFFTRSIPANRSTQRLLFCKCCCHCAFWAESYFTKPLNMWFQIWKGCPFVQKQSGGQCETMQQSSIWSAQDRWSLRNKVGKLSPFNLSGLSRLCTFVCFIFDDCICSSRSPCPFACSVFHRGIRQCTRKRKSTCSHIRYTTDDRHAASPPAIS